MSNFSVSGFFSERKKLNIQLFSVEDIDFELMALTDDQKEEVELCDTYDLMLSKAADFGLSYNRRRVADDEELAKDISLLWEQDELDIDLDPCVKFRVGEKVCEISGLSQVLKDRLEEEKAEPMSGDAGTQEEVSRLYEKAAQASA